jgi:hypothetical protein
VSKFTRKSFLAAAALFVAICTVAPRAALWAEEKMPDDHMKMMAADHMDKMKMMAADPDQAQKMAMEQAKLMVMDHMAKQLAMDPKVRQMAMQSMGDQNMKKVHDDAKAMAQDPAQMAKLQQEIMADPMSMQFVMHMADKMAMMHDSMMHDDKMKDMPAEKK